MALKIFIGPISRSVKILFIEKNPPGVSEYKNYTGWQQLLYGTDL